MSNYLARVATGGANTQTAARPPVAGPPLMPSADAGLTPIVGAVPGPITEPRTEHALPPLAHAETTSVIYAPRALRPAPAPTRRPPISSAEQIVTGDRISSPLPRPASSDDTVAAPTDGSGVRDRGIVAGEKIAAPVAHRSSRNPVEQVAQPQAQAQISPAQMARAGQEIATGGRISPATTQHAPGVTPPATARPPVRISIGQIDVQVNNRPPAPPARPAAPVDRGTADSLEQRGLERFRLRP